MNQKAKKITTLEEVIAEKGEEWRSTLDYARTTIPVKYLTDKNLVRLTKGAATIPQTQMMVKLLFQDSKERPVGVNGIDIFFRIVDYSNFNLGSWLEAMTYFQDWLADQNRTTPFQKMLGYIQCCEDSPENKDIDHKLIDLVKDMIKEHGYVG